MSSWLRREKDPAVAAQKKLEKEAKAVEGLRSLLQSDAGATAAQQLVQGGELTSAEDCTSDAYLRKWLFAREWDINLTYQCILKHAGWRSHVMPHGYVDEEWIQGPLQSERIYLQGVDSTGRALAIIKVAEHVADKKTLKNMKLFVCYVMNAMVALCDPQLNPRGRLVSMFDMTDASYANMDVAAMRMILGLLGQHYVERLDALYFYNPPSVFWGLWNSLKGLMPEVTRNKIKVIDPSDLQQLKDAVPAEVLPQQYGGTAELLPISEAVRRFKLPPYPHLPELRAAKVAAAAAAGLSPPSAASEASDAPSADDSSGPNAAYDSDGEELEFHDAQEDFVGEFDSLDLHSPPAAADTAAADTAAADTAAAGASSLAGSKLQQQQQQEVVTVKASSLGH